jgi:hypothetical protein
LQTQEQRKPILRYSLLARRSARTRAPLNRDHGVVRSWSDSDQIVAVPRMSALCHVWTAPSWQELSSRLQAWSVQPCVRPLSAVNMTAGHNALRGSGPGQ